MRTLRPNLLLIAGMAAALTVFAWPPNNVAAQDSAIRIGYVDMKRLLDNAPQVLAARAKLSQEFAARDDMLAQDAARLADQRQRLERERGTLETENLLRREDQLDSLERAIERTRLQLREELQHRTEQETERAWQEINEAVIVHARDAGFDLVVPSPVIYASARIDLTEAVLARLRADHSLAQEPRR